VQIVPRGNVKELAEALVVADPVGGLGHGLRAPAFNATVDDHDLHPKPWLATFLQIHGIGHPPPHNGVMTGRLWGLRRHIKPNGRGEGQPPIAVCRHNEGRIGQQN